jgi:hypothetical protein
MDIFFPAGHGWTFSFRLAMDGHFLSGCANPQVVSPAYGISPELVIIPGL